MPTKRRINLTAIILLESKTQRGQNVHIKRGREKSKNETLPVDDSNFFIFFFPVFLKKKKKHLYNVEHFATPSGVLKMIYYFIKDL